MADITKKYLMLKNNINTGSSCNTVFFFKVLEYILDSDSVRVSNEAISSMSMCVRGLTERYDDRQMADR